MAFADFLKSVFIPLTISLLLYFLVFFFALPLYRRHRARYSQYLPLQLTTSAAGAFPDASSLRSRLTHSFITILSRLPFPSAIPWLQAPQRRAINGSGVGDSDDDDEDDSDVEGRRLSSRMRTMDALGDEELDEPVWDGTDRPSTAAPVSQSHSHSRSRSRSESASRLSVDLEQGFRDSSDEEP